MSSKFLSDDEFLGGSAGGGSTLLSDDQFMGGATAPSKQPASGGILSDDEFLNGAPAAAKPKSDGGSFIPEVGKAVAAGAVSTVASGMKGAAGQNAAMLQSRIDDAKARLRAMDLIDAGKPVPADFGDELLGTQGEVYLNASPEERKGLRESQQTVIDTATQPGDVTQSPLFKAGTATQTFSDEQFKAAADYEGSWTRNIAEGLGSTLPFLVTGPTAGLAAGSAVSSGQQIDDAIKHGANKEQILQAVKLGGLPGLTEQLPIETLFERVPLPLYGRMAGAIGKVLGQAAAEGGQEMVQQVAQNLIAQYVYNPDQDISEGVLQAGAIGGIVGGGMKAVEPHTYRKGEAAQPKVPEASINIPQGAASADTLFGQESAGGPPPPSADTAAGGPPPPPAATSTDVDRPNSPRLTAEDRASPLPNNLIDDGKKIFDEALSGGRKTKAAAPLDGQIITPADQRDAARRVADIAGEFGPPDSQAAAPALERTIDGSLATAGPDAAPVPAPARQLSDEQFMASPVAAIAGPDTKDGMTQFKPESGTLNVPRSEMPQIKAEHRGAMVNFLTARGIGHQSETIPAGDLKPTQAEFSREKVDKAKAFEGGDRSILVSSDGYVLDGHHQWLAKLDAAQPVDIIRLDAPMKELLPVVREFPSATAETAATAPPIEGQKSTSPPEPSFLASIDRASFDKAPQANRDVAMQLGSMIDQMRAAGNTERADKLQPKLDAILKAIMPSTPTAAASAEPVRAGNKAARAVTPEILKSVLNILRTEPTHTFDSAVDEAYHRKLGGKPRPAPTAEETTQSSNAAPASYMFKAEKELPAGYTFGVSAKGEIALHDGKGVIVARSEQQSRTSVDWLVGKARAHAEHAAATEAKSKPSKQEALKADMKAKAEKAAKPEPKAAEPTPKAEPTVADKASEPKEDFSEADIPAFLKKDREKAALRPNDERAKLSGEVRPTEAFTAQAQDVGKRLRTELDRLGLKDIGLRISENLGLMVEGKFHAADGSYFQKLITVALDADNPDSVLDHEAIHALRDVGAFTKDEWSILERKSRKEWVGKYEIADTYGQFPEWVHVEEGVAHAYADWRAGRSMDGIIAKAFKKIRGVIQAIGKAFGKDFRTAADVFAQVASGGVGNRPGDVTANPVDAGGQPLFQSAWHGTPHEFDQFSLDKIGTGEGNQSFGWGLYFAGKKEIAEHYRKGLSYNQIVRDFREALPDDGDFSDVMDLVGTGHFTPYQDRVLKALNADDWLGFDYPSQAISAAYRHLDDHDPSQQLRDAIASSGKLFKVDLPEDGELMAWDKPLSEQPEGVKTAISSMKSPKSGLFSDATTRLRSERLTDLFAGKHWDTTTGSEFYGALNLALGGDKATSEALSAAGIPGHRYLDGQSRAAGEGTFNYVIYDDSRVSVEERFKLRSEPKTAEDRQKTMQGMIARGQPIDRALRLPFQFFGGIDEKGRWKPGLYVTDKAAKIITTAKIDPEGRFGWLAGPVEAARAGLIDRYGLSPEYIERDRQRHMDERSITMRGAEVLKTLADQNVGANEARVLQAILTGEAVTDKDMQGLAAPIRQAIDELGQEAVTLGLVSAESYERNRGSYLHRVYAKHESEQNNLQKLVSQIMGGKRKKIIGDTLKGRGLFWEVDSARLKQDGKVTQGEKYRVLDKVSAEDDGGKVTNRVYLPAGQDVPAKYTGKEWRDNGTWEARQIGKGKVTLWRDYSQAERTKMGEILDARYTIGKTYLHMAHDLAVGRFYKDIAENEDWASSSEPATKWVEADQRSRFLNDREVAWVKVPDTTISNTGGKKRWGALSGKWVRSEIWRDLNEIDIMNRPSTWRMLLSQWKLNKTARSPVVHMNNVMSNLMLMDMQDVRMQDLQAGLRSFVKKDKHWQDAMEHGVFGADMMTQEIRDNVLKPILEEMEKQGQDGVQNSFLARAGILGKFADRLWSLAKTADRTMIDLYRVEDDVFRLASYRAGIARGETPEHAAAAAREQFLDYDIRAPWVNAARNSLLPFISYTYRAVPLIARSMATRPWKIAKYAMVAYALNALAYAWDDDGDEDKERASLRDEEQGYTWLGTPRMLRMPFRNGDGLPVFLDARRWIPGGDVFDTNQGSSALPIPAPLQFGGPLMLAFELALNKSSFTGDPITNDLTDDWFDKSSKVGDYLWKAWLPSAAWVPNSWYWTKIKNAATGATDIKGRPYSLPEAVASSVGVKLKPQDVETGIFWHYKDMKDVEQALRAEARTLARQRDRGIISQKAFDTGMQSLIDKRDRLVEHVKELQRATRKK